jgi:succinylglutamic semialdehyde dehydrogenase
MTPSEHTSLFINNQWKPGTGPLFASYNPANGERLWQGDAASSQDVDEAVRCAQQASAEWSSLLFEERIPYLNAFKEILRDSQQTLATIISKETGKPLWDASNEVTSMINKIAISIDAYHQRCAPIVNDQTPIHSWTRHRPHGVVAVFGPYNFPGHLPNGHIIPALLAGNTVVFKPSELTPLVAEETLRCWQKVNLPKGVLNLVQGGRDTGQALLHHPAIQGLFFTGSYQTGKFLSEYFGSQPSKILALEMGGNNPLVIGQIQDLQAAAYLTIQSAYLSSGQRCTCARRLIVPQSTQGEAFLQVLVKMIGTLTIGPYDQVPEPFMGPVITEAHAHRLLDAQEKLKSKGGESLIEMRALQSGTGFISPGLMDVTPVVDRPDEEIFGPFLQLIRVKDFQSAIEEANHTQFGLAAGLLSDQQAEYEPFYRSIQAGVINWNTPLTGASSQAPFGGIKCSGNFRPSAYYAADYCAYPVASLETSQLKMPTVLTPGLPLIQPLTTENKNT